MTVEREKLMKAVRVARDDKLSRSDIDMLRMVEDAASFSALATARADWVAYRQALRDYPSQIPEVIEADLSNVPAIPLSPTEQAQEDASTE